MLHTFDSLAAPPSCDVSDIVPGTLALPTRTLDPDGVLYESGREASNLYVVNYGVLKAVVPTSLGRDRIADLYGPGDVLGLASLDGGHHAETVVAVHESCLTPIDPQQAMNDRKVRDYVLQSMARQLRRSREMIDEAEMPVGARVTRAFLRLADQFGQPSDESEHGVKLPLALTHEDLADLTGSSRVTITRILGELRSDGALSGTRGVYVADPEGLERATDHYVMQVL
ncbi:MAG: Crp/Fnr family transcriptional regulator [Trueperaceae bacterium]|jgi:CRP/FNR family transcriptional regulator|nr:Crp/Fnr family transcriptional regulator [Trueperaceae bacterium]